MRLRLFWIGKAEIAALEKEKAGASSRAPNVVLYKVKYIRE
jgi:hypothetical protein